MIKYKELLLNHEVALLFFFCCGIGKCPVNSVGITGIVLVRVVWVVKYVCCLLSSQDPHSIEYIRVRIWHVHARARRVYT